MIYYCIVHNIVVPRIIRNKSLPINLTGMTEKTNKNFRTSIVYIFWKKVDGLLRIDVETILNIARKLPLLRFASRAAAADFAFGNFIILTVVSIHMFKKMYRSLKLNNIISILRTFSHIMHRLFYCQSKLFFDSIKHV